MSERFIIKREVEVENGQEHVWWTVVDRESGYNKTFRTEAEAQAHAIGIRPLLAAAWAEGHGVGRTDEWGMEPNPYGSAE